MTTSLPFCKELAAAAGSSYVKDMMMEKFKREESALQLDELELRKKGQDIRSRIAERDFVIEELKQLFPFDSAVMSIAELTNMQIQDSAEITEILATVSKKQTRAAEVRRFIKWLNGQPY